MCGRIAQFVCTELGAPDSTLEGTVAPISAGGDVSIRLRPAGSSSSNAG